MARPDEFRFEGQQIEFVNAVTHHGLTLPATRRTLSRHIEERVVEARIDTKGVFRGGAKGAMAPSKKFEFILSKLRFRNRSAIFFEKPQGTTFRTKIWPPPKNNPGYAPAPV